MRETKCWTCKNSSGGCSWSRSFRPVKGWLAEKTVIKGIDGYLDSYLVIECPLYDKETLVEQKLHTNLAKRIAMVNPNGTVKNFDSMGECARWLIKNNVPGCVDYRTVSRGISKAADREKDGIFTYRQKIFKVLGGDE